MAADTMRWSGFIRGTCVAKNHGDCLYGKRQRRNSGLSANPRKDTAAVAATAATPATPATTAAAPQQGTYYAADYGNSGSVGGAPAASSSVIAADDGDLAGRAQVVDLAAVAAVAAVAETAWEKERERQRPAPVQSLKRYRLSVSPATGVVGLLENGYLGDFFGCLGFLPFASESIVRNAIVNVMVTAATGATTAPRGRQYTPSDSLGNPSLGIDHHNHHQQQQQLRLDIRAQNHLCGDIVGQAAGGGTGASGALIGWGLRYDPSACILWSAIALGALVRGTPMEHVSTYVRLARESLEGWRGDGTVDAARAFLVMAFFHSFLGDPAKNRDYLAIATAVLDTLPPHDIPVGLYDMLRVEDKSWIFEREPESARWRAIGGTLLRCPRRRG